MATNPPIPLREAVKRWEAATGEKASEAVEIKLNGFQPPIDKLDATLATFANCEKLSLSTNLIDKLSNFQTLTKLKILSVGRNLLKSLAGVEFLAGSLEQLWASYNNIDKLGPVASLKNLKALYLANNKVKDMKELNNLVDLPVLADLILIGCPLQITLEDNYRPSIAEALPQVKMLDGFFLTAEEEESEAPE